MGQYYFLIAGLPNLVFDSSKPPFAHTALRSKLTESLSISDRRLMDYLLLRFDNQNLLARLQNPDYELDNKGLIDFEEINALIEHAKASFNVIKAFEENGRYEIYFPHYLSLSPKPHLTSFRRKNKRLPAYIEQFIMEYLQAEANGEETVIPWADRLSALYYAYALQCPNALLAAWFEFNLNINNINAAITCRKHQLDRALYIVGHTAVADRLRVSNARDFDLSRILPYLTDLLHIAEEPDWLQREWQIDRLRWEWLDAQLFPKVFAVENVIAYWLKMEIMEHWSSLTKTGGETILEQIMDAMGQSGDHVLEEFKRNNMR